MGGRLRSDVPVPAASTWDAARRLREPIAWLLLALTASGLLVAVWELMNLPGTPPVARATVATASGVPVGPPTSITFGIRASAVAPQFVDDYLFALPLIAVVLVALAGGRTDHARPVVDAAIGIQAVTLGCGLLTWLGAFSANIRDSIWFITEARELATILAALILTTAVRYSRAFRRGNGWQLRAQPDRAR
jgi:hypothetical protein